MQVGLESVMEAGKNEMAAWETIKLVNMERNRVKPELGVRKSEAIVIVDQ